ncbi:MAG: glycosyltransferase, partial [Clostridia bacterium]|nr:glycosyltransferase [Clostridia bacterium]
MNIAFFADSYRPYTSGVVHSIDSFRSELTAQGHNVYIFCPGYKNYAPEPGVFRFKSLPAPTNKDFRIAIPLSLKIFSLARSLKLDIVHSHSPFLLGRLGQKVARKLDVPFVFTYHTLYEHYVHYVPFARTLSKWAVLRIAKDFCNRSDLVVVPTSIVEKMLKSAGVRTPLAVIPTGVDLTKFTRTDPGFLRSRLNLNSPHKIMLFVGRLGREKNLQFLLSCAAQIMRAEPLAVLVLVGGGPLGELLKRTADKLGVGSRTYFLG